MQSNQKFVDGQAARLAWKKALVPETCTIETLNAACSGLFSHYANIVLDPNPKRGTTLMVSHTSIDVWKQAGEYIYVIVNG